MQIMIIVFVVSKFIFLRGEREESTIIIIEFSFFIPVHAASCFSTFWRQTSGIEVTTSRLFWRLRFFFPLIFPLFSVYTGQGFPSMKTKLGWTIDFFITVEWGEFDRRDDFAFTWKTILNTVLRLLESPKLSLLVKVTLMWWMVKIYKKNGPKFFNIRKQTRKWIIRLPLH